MKTSCPKCKQEFEIVKDTIQAVKDNYLLLQCPLCKTGGIRLSVEIAKAVSAAPPPAEPAADVVPALLVCVNQEKKRTSVYPLKQGVNCIGRKSEVIKVDIAIDTTDLGMSRKHCAISITEDKRGRALFSIENHAEKNKVFLNWNFIKPFVYQDKFVLQDGDIIHLGNEPKECKDFLIFVENKPEYAGRKKMLKEDYEGGTVLL